MDLVAFYATVSGLSFTLLGLWWVVAERRRAWLVLPERRRMAYVVSLHFMLPGAMSVLSLVDTEGTFFWRLVFALAGVCGIAGAMLVASAVVVATGRRRMVAGVLALSLPVYVLVTVVAIAPSVADVVDMAPRQVEGVLVALVLLLGINAAWFLTTSPELDGTGDAAPAPDRQPAAGG